MPTSAAVQRYLWPVAVPGVTPPEAGGRLMLADPPTTVAVLGGFRLWWKGTVQGVPRASQRVLAFLALHGGSATRSTVAGTLWPDATESRAYSNLRSALARLNSDSRQVLCASKVELGLAEDVMVDLGHARMLARRLLDPGERPNHSDLGNTAVTAMSADLLPGWYDEWVLSAAEDWRQLRLHALEALARRLTGAGRWGEAAAAACAAVRADPFRESARAGLIQVHLAEGNQSEAVREFHRYRSLLRAELGLEPTIRLRHLVGGVPNQ
jgi:SARP family transcriptional regulator, regulator of embCAB operon